MAEDNAMDNDNTILFQTNAVSADGLNLATPCAQELGMVGAVVQHLQTMRNKLEACEELSEECIGMISSSSLEDALSSCISNGFATNATFKTFNDIESFKYFMHEHKTCIVHLHGVGQHPHARLDRHIIAGDDDGWYTACMYDASHVVFQDPANKMAGAYSFERMEWPEFESAFVEGGCLDIDDRTIVE